MAFPAAALPPPWCWLCVSWRSKALLKGWGSSQGSTWHGSSACAVLCSGVLPEPPALHWACPGSTHVTTAYPGCFGHWQQLTWALDRMPGSAGGSASCLSQPGANFIAISPCPRQMGLGAAPTVPKTGCSRSEWLSTDVLSLCQGYRFQSYCRWCLLPLKSCRFISCYVCKPALKIKPGWRFRSALPIVICICSPGIYRCIFLLCRHSPDSL